MAAITPLPTPVPSQADPENFPDRADALLGTLPVFVTEANAVAAAMNLNSLSSVSTTSVAIGIGSKSLTVEASKSYLPGMGVTIAYTTTPTNWMYGTVTSYNSGTGALVVSVTMIKGSGTYTAWTVTFSGPITEVYAVDTGAADDYAIAIETLEGQPFYFKAANANTGASVISTSNLTDVALKKGTAQDALVIGDIVAGIIYQAIYDGTSVQLLPNLNLDQKVFLLTATRAMNAASGDVAYTGCPFKPTSIEALGALPGNTVGQSEGFATGASDNFCTFKDENNLVQSAAELLRIYNYTGTGNYSQKAILKTFDNTGFTLTWTNVNNPSGTANLAFLLRK